MADNYLEKKMEDLQARKAKEARAKQIAWKKRMDTYRKKLEAEAAAAAATSATSAASAASAASSASVASAATGPHEPEGDIDD